MNGASGERILVIKHGALGDFVMALGPARAIREHHNDARVTLLTTPPFVELAEASGYFDEVWTDSRPPWYRIGTLLRLRACLRRAGFRRVYDLQTSDRSSLYFRFFPRHRRPEWSGIARGCSHPHDNPLRGRMHTIERQRDQLNRAGIAEVPPPSLDWVDADVAGFALGDAYCLLVPGGAAHRPGKRWPIAHYARIAAHLSAQGLRVAILGAAAEQDLVATILTAAPQAVSLVGQTSIMALAALARGARLAIGNDTGPMHIAAVAGCPSVVLFGSESDPARTAPRGPKVTVLRHDPLSALPVDEVCVAADRLLDP